MRESEFGAWGLFRMMSPLPVRAEAGVDSCIPPHAGPSSFLWECVLGGKVWGGSVRFFWFCFFEITERLLFIRG